MPITLLRSFHRFPEEAKIVGHLLAGYGELEFELCSCLSEILGGINVAAKTLFRARGEEQRILIADAIMRDRFKEIGLIHPYSEAIADMGWCRQVRNQFAHCLWNIDPTANSLTFVDLEEVAKTKTGDLILQWRRIDLPILILQEEYFCYVLQCLLFLEH